MHRKKISLILVVFFWAMAQGCWAQFSVGGELGVALPFGSLSNLVNTGFGGQGHASYYLNKNFSLGLGVGYYTFSGNEQTNSFEQYKANITPIVVKANYYFSEADFQPFVGLDAGFYRLASRFQVANTTQVLGESYWGLSPSVGLLVDTSHHLKLLGNIKYNYIASDIESTDFLTIHLGAIYVFSPEKNK